MKRNLGGVKFSLVRHRGISRMVSDRMKERDNNARLPAGYGNGRHLPVFWGILALMIYILIRVLLALFSG